MRNDSDSTLARNTRSRARCLRIRPTTCRAGSSARLQSLSRRFVTGIRDPATDRDYRELDAERRGADDRLLRSVTRKSAQGIVKTIICIGPASKSPRLGSLQTIEGTFDWAMAAYDNGVNQIRPDGTLPLEMARGRRAFHYHLYALAPLVLLAEFGEANQLDLYATRMERFIASSMYRWQAFRSNTL